MTEHGNSALVRRAVEAIWNNGARADADDLFAADYVNHGGLIPDLLHGPEAIKVRVALDRAAFPGLQIRVDGLAAQRDAVLLRWTAQSNQMAGSLTGLLVSRVANGTIISTRRRWTHHLFHHHLAGQFGSRGSGFRGQIALECDLV